MREHKYRAWDEENKKMVEVISLKFIRETTPEIIIVNGYLHITKPELLMPFIGIHDKNNKEIYIGDIIKTIQHIDGNFVDRIISYYEVIWSNFNFCLKCLDHYYSFVVSINLHGMEEREIIGNRFQNPELLTEKNNA